MEVYLWAFINFEQDIWARFLLMAEFAYTIAKNANISHISFELNYGYHLQVFYKKDVNPRSQLKWVDKLLNKFRKLVTICKEDLQHIQELQKQY